MKDSAKYNASSIELHNDGILILIGDHNDDDGNGHKEEIQTNDAWAPNYLLVVKIQILAIFIHSWANEYKLFSRLKCPMFQRELINFLFPRAPLTQLSLIGTPGGKAPEAKKGTQGPEGKYYGYKSYFEYCSQPA